VLAALVMQVRLVVLVVVDQRVQVPVQEAGEALAELVLTVTQAIPELRVPELQPVVAEALVQQVLMVIQVIQVQLELALQQVEQVALVAPEPTVTLEIPVLLAQEPLLEELLIQELLVQQET
jgi:hypothetical protein